MPVQAARLVQSGVGTVRDSVSQGVAAVPAVHAITQSVLGPRAAEEAGASSTQQAAGTGWKSGRLRAAIRSGTLADAMAEKQLENERLEAMVKELREQLCSKDHALAAASAQQAQQSQTDAGSDRVRPGAEPGARLTARRITFVGDKQLTPPAHRKLSASPETSRKGSILLPSPNARSHPVGGAIAGSAPMHGTASSLEQKEAFLGPGAKMELADSSSFTDGGRKLYALRPFELA